MKKLVVIVLIIISIIIIISCKKTPTPLSSSLKELNSLPECAPTPLNDGNAQIITAGSSYSISEVDIYLVNYGANSGTARMEIQGATASTDYIGNPIYIANGSILTNGSANNVFDAAITTMTGCARVPFYFSGCPVTAGNKYSLVIYWNGVLFNMGINNDLNQGPVAGQSDFVNCSFGPCTTAKRIAYEIYGY